MFVSWQDSIQLFKSYSKPSRAMNVLKVYLSYFVSRILQKPVVWGKPISVSIEPTTACNLRCPHCPSGLKQFSRPTGRLSFRNFEEIQQAIQSHVGYFTLYFQGEPYINADFLKMVNLASAQGIYTATSTNAHFLTANNAVETVKSGLKRIVISIDGSSQDTYEHYRIDGSLAKVLEGTQNLVAAKEKLKAKYPVVLWQFIVFKHNEHQLNEVKKLAQQYKVDKLAIKTAQIYDYENAQDWLPQNEALSRYAKKDNEVKIKNKLLNHCWRLWSGCVITWDTRVVPCCFDKDAEYNMGNLTESAFDFDSIWNGKSYQQFRNQLVDGRKNIDICKNCSEGTKVWA